MYRSFFLPGEPLCLELGFVQAHLQKYLWLLGKRVRVKRQAVGSNKNKNTKFKI